MLNAKTGLLLILVGLLASHYVYLHDLVTGSGQIQMGPTSWTIAVVALVVGLVGLWLVWRGEGGASQ